MEAGIKISGDGSGLSILKGQQVLMDDGSQKNIENVKERDEITSYNIESGKTENDKVLQITLGSHSDYLVFNGQLKTSLNHIIWSNGEFKPAEDIKVGELLLNSEGQEVEVMQIQYVPEKVDTYDLTVEKNHNFFVSNYLVHNAGQSLCTQVYVVVDYTAAGGGATASPPRVMRLFEGFRIKLISGRVIINQH